MLNFWQQVYMEAAGDLVVLFLFVFHTDLLILPNLEIGWAQNKWNNLEGP